MTDGCGEKNSRVEVWSVREQKTTMREVRTIEWAGMHAGRHASWSMTGPTGHTRREILEGLV